MKTDIESRIDGFYKKFLYKAPGSIVLDKSRKKV